MKYQKEQGGNQPPQSFRTKDGVNLGDWCHSQRRSRYKMKPERRARLDAVNFDWGKHSVPKEFQKKLLEDEKQRKEASDEHEWNKCYLAVCALRNRVPWSKNRLDLATLDAWCLLQKQETTSLNAFQKEKLDGIEFFKWDLSKGLAALYPASAKPI